jgi:hypothetical protein
VLLDSGQFAVIRRPGQYSTRPEEADFSDLREKETITRAFSRYVARQVVAEILKGPERLVLKEERRDVTVLSSRFATSGASPSNCRARRSSSSSTTSTFEHRGDPQRVLR